MKKGIAFLICLMMSLVLLTACNQTIPTPEGVVSGSAYKKITVADAKVLLDSDATLTLVDVRRSNEYTIAHIPGAVNIPNESIEITRQDALPDLNRTIVVYCRADVSSKQAADKLVEIGYSDVRDMGGFADWSYDTVSGTEPGEYVEAGSESDTSSEGIMSSFSANNLDGNNIDQSIFEAYDLTMVNVWATYCGPCLSEMPDLGVLADEYESKGVRIVGMVTDVLNSNGTVNNNQLDTARAIIARTGADYMHIIPSEGLYGLLSQITAVPTTVFVDSDGAQVGKSFIGSKSKAEWKAIIEQMLEEAQK